MQGFCLSCIPRWAVDMGCNSAEAATEIVLSDSASKVEPTPRVLKRTMPKKVEPTQSSDLMSQTKMESTHASGEATMSQSTYADPTITIGPFQLLVNRGVKNFEVAVQKLALDYPDHKSDVIFTYFDVYGGKTMPELPRHQRDVQLLDRALTNDFDNKREFALMLQSAMCEHVFAPTYVDAEQALQATAGCHEALFFVKSSTGTAGKGMQVLTRQALEENGAIPQWHIAQLAVQDLALIDNCKFTIRTYVLVHNRELLFHRRGVVTVHGKPYDRLSADFDVQISHDTTATGSEVKIHPLHSYSQGTAWRNAIFQSTREMIPALQPLLEASSTDRYTIIGIDALITNLGEARLIEINLYPNLWDWNEQINSEVKQPMLRDCLARMLLGAIPPQLDLI